MKEIKKINVRDKTVTVVIDRDYGTVKVDNLFIPSVSDFTYYVNKLSDIAEDLLESNGGN